MCNTEETGILAVQEPGLFLSPKDQKQQAMSPDGKEKAVLVLCA